MSSESEWILKMPGEQVATDGDDMGSSGRILKYCGVMGEDALFREVTIVIADAATCFHSDFRYPVNRVCQEHIVLLGKPYEYKVEEACVLGLIIKNVLHLKPVVINQGGGEA